MNQIMAYGQAGLPAGIQAGLSLLGDRQGRKPKAKGRKFYPPALPSSRPTALESLLSVALSSAWRIRLYHPHFRAPKNGLIFDVKVVSFSVLSLIPHSPKWSRFRS